MGFRNAVAGKVKSRIEKDLQKNQGAVLQLVQSTTAEILRADYTEYIKEAINKAVRELVKEHRSREEKKNDTEQNTP